MTNLGGHRTYDGRRFGVPPEFTLRLYTESEKARNHEEEIVRYMAQQREALYDRSAIFYTPPRYEHI